LRQTHREKMGCIVNNGGKETKMRRVSQARMLLLVVAVTVLWIVSAVHAGQKGAATDGAPKPDGKFQLMTTSIAPNMGVSWADGRFSYQGQTYKFRVEAETMGEGTALRDLAGEQIAYEGLVYNLKNPSDFAGTYTRVKPEVVKAMGVRGAVFENENGVVVRVTRTIKSREDQSLRLLTDSFKVSMRDF
jgi:hypothetical protein